MMLYLYGFSPRIHTTLDRFQQIIKHQLKNGYEAGIVFLQDAVVGAVPRGAMPPQVLTLRDMGVKLYVLGEDLDARGLSGLPLGEGIVRINYDELIRLIVESDTLCSWL